MEIYQDNAFKCLEKTMKVQSAQPVDIAQAYWAL